MSRRSFETELVEFRFKHYSQSVRDEISRAYAEDHSADNSDATIARLWLNCRRAMRGVIDDKTAKKDLTHKDIEKIRRFINQATKYETELAELDDDPFEELYQKTSKPIAEEKRRRLRQKAKEMDRWDFFSKSCANADFEQWKDCRVTPAQAVSLLLGKDPGIVKPESLKPYHTAIGSPFRERYFYLLMQLEAYVAKECLSIPMLLKNYVKWAIELDIFIPSELRDIFSINPEESIDYWKSRYIDAQKLIDELRKGVDEINGLTKKSLYTIMIGMAVSKYGYNTSGYSSAPTNIQNACELSNLDINVGTVRDHLKAAAQCLGFERLKPT